MRLSFSLLMFCSVLLIAGAHAQQVLPLDKITNQAELDKTVTALDALSGIAPGSFKVTGTSNEPSDPNDPDIVITPNGSGGFVVQLREDRLGTGTGRVYTLSATAMDLAGNSATATATCTVPHDQQ